MRGKYRLCAIKQNEHNEIWTDLEIVWETGNRCHEIWIIDFFEIVRFCRLLFLNWHWKCGVKISSNSLIIKVLAWAITSPSNRKVDSGNGIFLGLILMMAGYIGGIASHLYIPNMLCVYLYLFKKKKKK